MSSKQPAIIDLFCGAGGFSLGAHLNGLDVVAAVDKDEVLTSCYRRNFPSASLKIRDISQLNGLELLTVSGLTPGGNFGIIGGPPCQGFSLIGKRDANDSRNSLVGHFFRLVAETRPRFFIMENVPGILLGDAARVLEQAQTRLSGYTFFGPALINAADYGAPTERHRVVIIGLRGSSLFQESLLSQERVKKKVTVRCAISDLPEPHITGTAPYRSGSPSRYAMSARMVLPNLGSAEARDLSRSGKVSGMMPTKHTRAVEERFGDVPQGKTDPISRFPRLAWHAQAPTLRAGTGPDHGSFQSVRPLHPEKDRVITVREAARLQGFPDWFEFHTTKWHSFRMIGNSVSPIVSATLIRAVLSHLTSAPDGN